jgi:hypothetical protein
MTQATENVNPLHFVITGWSEDDHYSRNMQSYLLRCFLTSNGNEVVNISNNNNNTTY